MSRLASSRRSFLKAVGTTALTLPFYRLLCNSAAEADSSSSYPLRFLCIYTPHGTAFEYWRPQGTETNFNITYPSAILAPLAPYQSKMIVLDGISLACSDGVAGAGGHANPAALLTGVPAQVPDGGTAAVSGTGGESLDQYLGRTIGTTTAFPSLELSVGDWDHYIQMSFDQTGATVPRQNNPLAVFNRVFAGVTSGASSAPSAAALRNLAEQKSVLDAVQADIARLRPRLAAPEQAKLDLHLTAVRDIENRLSAPPTPATCTVPPAPTGDWTATTSIDEYFTPQYIPEFATITELQLDMIAQSFACDLTRIATLQIQHTSAEIGMPYADPTLANIDIHTNIAHKYVYMSGDAISQQMQVMQLYYANKVAYLLNALSKIPEGSGTVLDHTIVLWTTDLGDPANHTNNSVPMVLLGGANNAWQMGRYLQLSTQTPSDNPTGAIPHNQLLVSICQAFGLNVNTYGWTGSTGPLASLA